MTYVVTGIVFVVVCISLFAWRMMRDAPTIVSGEPVQPELGGPTGLATGDQSGIPAGADGGSTDGADGSGGAQT